MGSKYILIDCIYINQGGGNTLVKLIIDKLYKIENIFFIFDSRLPLNTYKKINSNNFKVITGNKIIGRRSFYLNQLENISKIICLANIPPPISVKINVIIYFHNTILLPPFKESKFLIPKFLSALKYIYISFYNRFNYNWVFQTPIVAESFLRFHRTPKERIKILPFFQISSGSKSEKISSTFFYPSFYEAHKNHKILINAFIDSAFQSDKEIILHLTINNEKILKYRFPKNLKVICHGNLSLNQVNEIYSKSKFLIFPSLTESFGLPLIEASNHNCKVIASDLPYVHEIISPSLTFDPYSVESISESILKAVETDNLPETKVLVENKLNNFIEFIISQDVQR